MTITVASNNTHKIDEIRSMLSHTPDILLISMREVGYTAEIVENGTTFEENARIKADTIYSYTRQPVIADDSGLCVDTLNGAPGIYSARYMNLPDDTQRYTALLTQLSGVPLSGRTARFVCLLAYVDQSGNTHSFTGICEGHIAEEPAGDNGFGYDPVFIPRGYSCTMAQLEPHVKNRISHRADALNQWISFL